MDKEERKHKVLDKAYDLRGFSGIIGLGLALVIGAFIVHKLWLLPIGLLLIIGGSRASSNTWKKL
jgi:hypothetical protein